MARNVRRFTCPKCQAKVAVADESVMTYCGTYFLNNPIVDIEDFMATGCPHCKAAIPFSAEERTED